MRSPIRYFGGKGIMFKEIIGHFPDPSTYEVYIEPFGGAASILFQKDPTPMEIYNDIEQNVYALFKVLSDPKQFIEFKKQCDLFYYSHQIRDEFKNDLKRSDLSLLERAYRFFLINRTSINGIGGFSRNMVVRRNMSKSVSDMLSAIDGLTDVHNRLSSVIIENCDGIQLIKKYDRSNVFIYADPPYHQSTRGETRYNADMEDDQQKKFIDALISLKECKVLLSGYDCYEYTTLTKHGWKQYNFQINTTDGNRKPKSKTETVWKNYVREEKETIFNI